jgi:hypothetical protein
MFDFNLPASDPSNPNNFVMTPEQRSIRLAAALRQQQAGSDKPDTVSMAGCCEAGAGAHGRSR